MNNSLNIHDHPHYKRWSGFVQRTSNPKVRGFKTLGARNIKVEYIWSKENMLGLVNFGNWVEEQLRKQPEFIGTDFKVGRVNINENYGPSNCVLTSAVKICQNRITSVLTFDLVVAMRKHIKAYPETTLLEMAVKFDHDSIVNISRAVRGVSWKNVNSTESPFVRVIEPK